MFADRVTLDAAQFTGWPRLVSYLVKMSYHALCGLLLAGCVRLCRVASITLCDPIWQVTPCK